MKRLALLSVFLALPLAAQPPKAALHAVLGQSGSTVPSVTLTWTASLTTGGTVTVLRCTGTACTAGSGTFTPIATAIVAAGPYTDTAVTAGVYAYYVVAIVNGASSVPSNIVQVTVTPLPPTALSASAVN